MVQTKVEVFTFNDRSSDILHFCHKHGVLLDAFITYLFGNPDWGKYLVGLGLGNPSDLENYIDNRFSFWEVSDVFIDLVVHKAFYADGVNDDGDVRLTIYVIVD